MAIQIVRTLVADVVKRGSARMVTAKQNDVNTRFLNVTIQEDGNDLKIDPTATVYLNIERPDHAENIFQGSVNEDGTVKVPLTTWALEHEGTLVCDISIVDEDPAVAKLTTMQFNVFVEAAAVTDEDIPATAEGSVLVELLDRVEAAEESISSSAALSTATVAQATQLVQDLVAARDRGDFNGRDGIDGKDGAAGPAGAAGKDGYTPKRGTDYWTAADKAEILNSINALPLTGGTLTGKLIMVNGSGVKGDTWTSMGFFDPDGNSRGSMMISDANTWHVNVKETGTTYADRYALPAPTANKTADTWYYFLTTKAAVTVAQGGTGSTNGATGLKNLLAAGNTVLSSYQYGTSLPAAGTPGRIFFKKV